MDNNIQVSFVIPHKGRIEMLAQTVHSIWQQNFAAEQFEILIISQNTELDESQLCAIDGRKPNIYFQSENKTISALRNFGVQQAKGDYIAFLDADVALAENWLAELLPLLQNNSDIALVSAKQACEDDAPVLEQIRTNLSNAEVDCFVRFLPGRNLLLAKSTFYQAGQFPEHLVTCEDYYFTDQVYQLGKLFYSANTSYLHLGEDKQLNEMFKKEIWRGQSNIQSIKGRRIPFSELPSFLVPLWIAVFTLISLIALFYSIDIAFISLALAVLPIFIYALRLYQLPANQVSYWQILKFYCVYFPARIIGTWGGIVKTMELKQQ